MPQREIPKYHGCRVAAGQAADVPAGVAAAAAEVEVCHRHPVGAESGDRSEREELLEGQVTVKDVPSDEPVRVLHFVGTDHLAMQDRVGKAGRDRVDARDDAVRIRLQFCVVLVRRERVRYPLREH